jgi:hypothetical protein
VRSIATRKPIVSASRKSRTSRENVSTVAAVIEQQFAELIADPRP